MKRRDTFDERTAQAIAGFLDLAPAEFVFGRNLPMMWHQFYFLDRPAQRELGVDGHPTTGTRTPPGMRRMFAGGKVTALRELKIGDTADATTVLVSDETRQGRSGSLRFVKYRTLISVDRELCLVDERDIVYLPLSTPVSSPRTESIENRGLKPDACLDFTVDSAFLFRFSALTYNAHRIHYDRDYARDVEGYPGLVVHGPLQALLMAEFATRHRLVRRPAPQWEFAYRLQAPLFEHDGCQVLMREQQEELQLEVAATRGRTTATAQLRLAGESAG